MWTIKAKQNWPVTIHETDSTLFAKVSSFFLPRDGSDFAEPYFLPTIIPHWNLIKSYLSGPFFFAHLEYTGLPWEVSCWWDECIIKNALDITTRDIICPAASRASGVRLRLLDLSLWCKKTRLVCTLYLRTHGWPRLRTVLPSLFSISPIWAQLSCRCGWFARV